MPLSSDLKDILASLTTKQDLKAILASMATKQDMDAQTERLEASLRREINDIQAETTATSGRVDQLEQTTATIQQQVVNMETSHATMLSQLHSHNMLIDDLENRSRRNNVKIRGLPESIANTELKSTVLQLFSSILGSSEGSGVELDRVHRSLGAQQQDRPRDVLCRIHYFTTKEQIIQKAWEKRPLNFNGHEILILPDLSRRTLFMRNQLKPLLQLISSAEGTYKWGHPFHLLIRKGGRSFRLLTPSQLPDVFAFLQVNPIEIPDWTILAPSSSVPRPPRRRSRSGRRRMRE